jgi:hypothetical protein
LKVETKNKQQKIVEQKIEESKNDNIFLYITIGLLILIISSIIAGISYKIYKSKQWQVRMTTIEAFENPHYSKEPENNQRRDFQGHQAQGVTTLGQRYQVERQKSQVEDRKNQVDIQGSQVEGKLSSQVENQMNQVENGTSQVEGRNKQVESISSQVDRQKNQITGCQVADISSQVEKSSSQVQGHPAIKIQVQGQVNQSQGQKLKDNVQNFQIDQVQRIKVENNQRNNQNQSQDHLQGHAHHQDHQKSTKNSKESSKKSKSSFDSYHEFHNVELNEEARYVNFESIINAENEKIIASDHVYEEVKDDQDKAENCYENQNYEH